MLKKKKLLLNQTKLWRIGEVVNLGANVSTSEISSVVDACRNTENGIVCLHHSRRRHRHSVFHLRCSNCKATEIRLLAESRFTFCPSHKKFDFRRRLSHILHEEPQWWNSYKALQWTPGQGGNVSILKVSWQKFNVENDSYDKNNWNRLLTKILAFLFSIGFTFGIPCFQERNGLLESKLALQWLWQASQSSNVFSLPCAAQNGDNMQQLSRGTEK